MPLLRRSWSRSCPGPRTRPPRRTPDRAAARRGARRWVPVGRPAAPGGCPAGARRRSWTGTRGPRTGGLRRGRPCSARARWNTGADPWAARAIPAGAARIGRVRGDRIACGDIGSTYTKAALVEVGTGAVIATAQAATALDDVVTGVLTATAG